MAIAQKDLLVLLQLFSGLNLALNRTQSLMNTVRPSAEPRRRQDKHKFGLLTSVQYAYVFGFAPKVV
jgi:hypothetical protein